MSKVTSGRPIKMWIDGACYNVTRFKELHKKEERQLENLTSLETHGFPLSKDENTVSTSFQVPSFYYTRLDKFPNFCLKRLETATSTVITVPKYGEDGHVVIRGNKETDVVSARHRIHSVFSEIREKQAVTQFISIPVHSEEVRRNFEKFKQEILNGDPIDGIEESIFQSSLKLHLTIVVFALMGKSEQEEAIAALNACKTEIIEPLIASTGPLKIKIFGTNCMNDNSAKANVLYANAKIENDAQEDVLQNIANSISNYFYERGLVIQYKDNVKLHVTLLNTKYRARSAQNTPKRSKWSVKRQPFNASSILEKYKDLYLGESVLDSIHLSNMSKGEDGFYKPLSVITF